MTKQTIESLRYTLTSLQKRQSRLVFAKSAGLLLLALSTLAAAGIGYAAAFTSSGYASVGLLAVMLASGVGVTVLILRSSRRGLCRRAAARLRAAPSYLSRIRSQPVHCGSARSFSGLCRAAVARRRRSPRDSTARSSAGGFGAGTAHFLILRPCSTHRNRSGPNRIAGAAQRSTGAYDAFCGDRRSRG